jgi:tetratricopeptide (TPR) repeat protein
VAFFVGIVFAYQSYPRQFVDELPFFNQTKANMHIELQQTIQHLMGNQHLSAKEVEKEVSRFTPVDFRLGIQWLVTQDKPDLAQALAEAGLSLFPQSEDILAISGLLAMSREDWALAIELLQDLVTLQQERVQPMTCQMLARALASNLDLAEAHVVLDRALKMWPDNAALLNELSTLASTHDVMSASPHTN